MPDTADLLKAIHHIVHDYSNLVSAGVAIRQCPPPPLNSHVAYSFILQSRKFAHFFLNRESRTGKQDILAAHYVGRRVRFLLPEWSKWRDHMDYHIFHLSCRRLKNTRPWDGSEHPIVLEQFQTAWREFLKHLQPSFRTEFDREIDLKLQQVDGEQELILR